jgi:acyl-CoA synthetase (AMP-forming)/AMP-acid ligase II
MEFNLADLFECVADHVPDRDALVGGDRRLSYAGLEERANRLAHGLERRGVGPEDHVGLYLHNRVEFIEVMLACFKLRAVPFNINYRYRGEELAYVLGDAGAVAVVFDDRLADLVAEAGLAVRSLRLRLAVGAEYEAVVAEGGPGRDFGPRSADDHYLLYTGGTTGLPKGVVWRHEDILFATLGGGNPGGPPIAHPEEIAHTVAVNRAQRLRPFLPPGEPEPDEFTVLALGPLMHASGQWSALGALLGGGKVVLYPHRSMDMDKVLELVEREHVTMLTLVGDTSGRPLVETLVARPGAWDTSSLRLLGSGGSILSAAVKEQLLDALPSVLAITEAVGSSEAPVQAISIVRRGGPPLTTLRFAAKDVTAVLDADGRPVPPGSGVVGRLATRGHVPVGYHNDPDRTATTFVDFDGARWSLPGDMATVDADGAIQLLGRGSLCINTGGEKVYPEEVEAVVTAHRKVADAVVVGVADRQWGERVVAVVQPSSGSDPPTLAEVQDHCRNFVAGYKLPRQLVVVDLVRRSPSGKPDYPWAQALAADAPSSAGAGGGRPPHPRGVF